MRPRPKGPEAEARGYEAEAKAEAEAKILVFKILLKILIEDLVFSIINTFTARRVCIARTMLSQDVCLSVRRTPVLSLNGYTYHQSFFHRRLSPPF